jgi:hypothetical protein
MVYAVLLEHSPECEFAPESRKALQSSLQLFELGVAYGSGRAKQALVSITLLNCGYQSS